MRSKQNFDQALINNGNSMQCIVDMGWRFCCFGGFLFEMFSCGYFACCC